MFKIKNINIYDTYYAIGKILIKKTLMYIVLLAIIAYLVSIQASKANRNHSHLNFVASKSNSNSENCKTSSSPTNNFKCIVDKTKSQLKVLKNKREFMYKNN